MPPRVVASRLIAEGRVELERVLGPRRNRRTDLLQKTGARSIDELWESVLDRPYPFVRASAELQEIGARWPEEPPRVLAAARRALEHEIDLLGTGPVELGDPIDWHRDWKTGRTWPLRYGPRMRYAELDRPSDVKVPWEISRVQWLVPAGQAYSFTRDEMYAAGVRNVLDDWLRANPYGRGVNWSLAMEPALRVFSWSWLLYACGRSGAWSEPAFRSRFLRGLYLHGEFVDRHLERSEINGNHYVADAAALVVAGLVLDVDRWARKGWSILQVELPRQVHPDGVDFEASAAYHRLVGELFALPALLRRARGLEVPPAYVERIEAMGRFTEAYTGPDGLAPLWGDADDGRALPLGGQDVNDHRSLPVLAAHLAGRVVAGNAEAAWLVGPAAVGKAEGAHHSTAFRDGGVFVLRGDGDHVFVVCGPAGLAGRGGHGHNDCLGFEATLDGVRVVRDCGSYVYTASPAARNRFRSTAFHSTPRIDGEEQNRFDPALLWTMTEDALPDLRSWEPHRFQGAHSGYQRLARPVTPVRTIELERGSHVLTVVDEFEGEGEHLVEIPLQLAPGVTVAESGHGSLALSPGFRLTWDAPADWTLELGTGWVSPRYGVKVEAPRLTWTRRGRLRPLRVVIAPASS